MWAVGVMVEGAVEGVNEHVSALMKIKRLSLIKYEVGGSSRGRTHVADVQPCNELEKWRRQANKPNFVLHVLRPIYLPRIPASDFIVID